MSSVAQVEVTQQSEELRQMVAKLRNNDVLQKVSRNAEITESYKTFSPDAELLDLVKKTLKVCTSNADGAWHNAAQRLRRIGNVLSFLWRSPGPWHHYLQWTVLLHSYHHRPYQRPRILRPWRAFSQRHSFLLW
jgi:hypothetical protein